MVSGELAGECRQTGFERHGLPPQKAPLDTVYPLREHLESVQRMVSYTRKFLGDFPGTSLTVDFKSNLEVPQEFPRFFQKLPWTS